MIICALRLYRVASFNVLIISQSEEMKQGLASKHSAGFLNHLSIKEATVESATGFQTNKYEELLPFNSLVFFAYVLLSGIMANYCIITYWCN